MGRSRNVGGVVNSTTSAEFGVSRSEEAENKEVGLALSASI